MCIYLYICMWVWWCSTLPLHCRTTPLCHFTAAPHHFATLLQHHTTLPLCCSTTPLCHFTAAPHHFGAPHNIATTHHCPTKQHWRTILFGSLLLAPHSKAHPPCHIRASTLAPTWYGGVIIDTFEISTN